MKKRDLNEQVSLNRITQRDSLTKREQEIIGLVQAGLTNQEIALKLNISINTVKMHLQNIYAKLSVRKRSKLISLLK